MNKEDKTTKIVKRVLKKFNIKLKTKTEKLFIQILFRQERRWVMNIQLTV